MRLYILDTGLVARFTLIAEPHNLSLTNTLAKNSPFFLKSVAAIALLCQLTYV
jgi:hypothetical protein